MHHIDEHESDTEMLQRVLEGLRRQGDDQQDEEPEEGTS